MKSLLLARACLLVLCLALPGLAQNRFRPVYHVLKTTVQGGTAEVVTVQNPRSDGKQINILGVFVECSAACTWQVEMDGTTAVGGSAALMTPVKGTKRLDTSRAVVYSASNTASPRFSIGYSNSTTDPYPVSFGGMYSLPGDGTNSNFTVRMITNNVTAKIFIQYEEP
jgi:hypothetical protein